MLHDGRQLGRGQGPDPIDIHVGERLRHLRRAQRITQEDLSAAAGVTFQQIQKYERGANRVSASMMVRICRFLKLPVSALFQGLPDQVDAEAAETDEDARIRLLVLDHDVRGLLMHWARLGAEDQELLLKCAERLARRRGEADV